ncbi:hypothetical protein [Fictibacillus phosphorivorans]|uniref:hypothetical protein n=1 Tax=Fictibacillus phosphorivorans TaxID=1221500 RepID=UPI0012E7FD98|nr:hypothetical protein [Fictibacillus phosphorivorans]
MKRTNVAHRLPRGKRASVTEINYFQEQQSNHLKFNNKNPLCKIGNYDKFGIGSQENVFLGGNDSWKALFKVR